MTERIRFNLPYYQEKDILSIKRYLLEGTSPADEATGHLMKKTGAKAVFLTAGATSAMDLYFAAADYPAGKEVIMPSYTFPAAANAVIRAGLKPMFTDIKADTMVLSMDAVRKNLTEDTCCIMPVHYGGVSVDMDELIGTALEAGVEVFEDSALSYLGYYNNQHLGTLGRAGVLSFHSTKNISADGGGALLLNDPAMIEKTAELLANGTNRPAFLRGEVSEYSWQRAGNGTAMSGLSAALLISQLEKDDEIMMKRSEIWTAYYEQLNDSSVKKHARLPVIPAYNRNNNHVFYLRFDTNELRETVRKSLAAAGIEAVIHYKPLHASDMGMSIGYMPEDLPVTLREADCLLRLPLHMALTPNDVRRICDSIKAVIKDA